MNEVDFKELRSFLDVNNELVLLRETGKIFSLKAREIELEFNRDRTLFSFLDESGFQTWRIVDADFDKSKVILKLTKNFQTETSRIELIARKKAEELSETVELARLERANGIANVLVSETDSSKLIRVELNKENGRFAQIIIEKKGHGQIAVLADVTEKISPEVLLSFAIIWLSRLRRRKKNPIDEIWLISQKRAAKRLNRLCACLRENWKNKLKVFELKSQYSQMKLLKLKPLEISNLWREKPQQLRVFKNQSLSDTSREIIKLAPDAIDFLRSKNGETLRYLGLPFLRIRETLGEEKSWFGTEPNRRVLREDSFEDFNELLGNLKEYRSFEAPNRYHAFYETAPEAWLESILRQNIQLLDTNLVLSQIYNQFRTSRDKIDLLALRKDGRLVIIELKVSPDREMIFQAIDYWRKNCSDDQKDEQAHSLAEQLFGSGDCGTVDVARTVNTEHDLFWPHKKLRRGTRRARLASLRRGSHYRCFAGRSLRRCCDI